MATALVTAPPDAADELAQLLVEERLAACVNRTDVESVYRWEGEVHDEPEALLLAKTTDERYDDLVERVVEEHPYEVPCVERFDADDGLVAFEQWRDENVR